MWKESLSRNCLQSENLICFATALSPRNKNVDGKFYGFRYFYFPRMVSLESSLSARTRPRQWREQVTACSLHTLFTVCYSRGKGYLTFNTTCHQNQLPRILYKLKDSVNALKKLDHMILSLHFHFNLSCECEAWPRIGHLILWDWTETSLKSPFLLQLLTCFNTSFCQFIPIQIKISQ